jgi:hypothetical protein
MIKYITSKYNPDLRILKVSDLKKNNVDTEQVIHTLAIARKVSSHIHLDAATFHDFLCYAYDSSASAHAEVYDDDDDFMQGYIYRCYAKINLDRKDIESIIKYDDVLLLRRYLKMYPLATEDLIPKCHKSPRCLDHLSPSHPDLLRAIVRSDDIEFLRKKNIYTDRLKDIAKMYNSRCCAVYICSQDKDYLWLAKIIADNTDPYMTISFMDIAHSLGINMNQLIAKLEIVCICNNMMKLYRRLMSPFLDFLEYYVNYEKSIEICLGYDKDLKFVDEIDARSINRRKLKTVRVRHNFQIEICKKFKLKYTVEKMETHKKAMSSVIDKCCNIIPEDMIPIISGYILC